MAESVLCPPGSNRCRVLALAGAGLLGSCVGVVDPGPQPGPSTDPATTASPAAERCRPGAVNRTVLRRLNHREYENTIRDLLGVTGVGVGVPADVSGGAALDTNAS